MLTARGFGLLRRSCAISPINSGVQPRRTRWKEKLPKNQQPCKVLSAIFGHALWAREVEFQKLRARPVTRILLHAYVTIKGKRGKRGSIFWQAAHLRGHVALPAGRPLRSLKHALPLCKAIQ